MKVRCSLVWMDAGCLSLSLHELAAAFVVCLVQLQTRIPRTQLVDNGSYAEYIITVLVDGQEWTVHKRYREFDGAYAGLQLTSPSSISAHPEKGVCERAELQGKVVKSVDLPPFPQKKWFGSNSPEVIEQRREQLERWLSGTHHTPVPPSPPLCREAHAQRCTSVCNFRIYSRGADTGMFNRSCVPGFPRCAAPLASGTCQRGRV